MAKNERSRSASAGYLVREGLRNIRTNRLMSLASVAVLFSCLVILGGAFLVIVNINLFMGEMSEQNIIIAFVDDSADEAETERVGNEIKAVVNVSKCEFIPKEEAYQEQLESLGDAAVVFEGVENPLPDAYRITLSDMSIFDETVASISAIDNVLSIKQNRDIARQLSGLKRTVSSVSAGIIVTLFLVSLFIISNTIRITVYSRRLEIGIMKSVGATKAFIKLPFVVEGIVLGLLAGGAAFGAVWGVYSIVIDAVADMLNVFSAKPVSFMTYFRELLIFFLATGVLTGAVGSSFSMNKYLKEQSYDTEELD